jgi:hypothetical protein
VAAEAEVVPAPPPETGEGSLAAPVATTPGGGSSPTAVLRVEETPKASTRLAAEDLPKVATEPTTEDSKAAAGSSQVS